METLLAVQLVNLALKGALDAGMSWAAFRAAQDKAQAEGRTQLNDEELRALVARSQAAVDRL